jgi:hypothetical protein
VREGVNDWETFPVRRSRGQRVEVRSGYSRDTCQWRTESDKRRGCTGVPECRPVGLANTVSGDTTPQAVSTEHLLVHTPPGQKLELLARPMLFKKVVICRPFLFTILIEVFGQAISGGA